MSVQDSERGKRQLPQLVYCRMDEFSEKKIGLDVLFIQSKYRYSIVYEKRESLHFHSFTLVRFHWSF